MAHLRTLRRDCQLLNQEIGSRISKGMQWVTLRYAMGNAEVCNG